MIGDTNLPNPSVVPRRIASWTRDPRASLGLTEPFFPKFLLSTAFIVPPFSRESSVYFRWTTTPGHSCRAACPGATTIDGATAPSSAAVRSA